MAARSGFWRYLWPSRRSNVGVSDRRATYQLAVQDWEDTKSRELVSLRVPNSFVGYAHKLASHPEVLSHLSRVPHFGVLQEIPKDGLSRFNYVEHQCALALELKKALPRLGLGSKVKLAALPFDLTRLELLQCWFVLASAGHLFGTFATERALLFTLKREPGIEAKLLKQIPAAYQEHANGILKAKSMYRFVYFLALWRFSTSSSLADVRDNALAMLASYINTPEELVRLKSVAKAVRRVAYVRMHQALPAPLAITERDHGRVIADLLQHDDIELDASHASSTPTAQLLESLDEYHYDAVFTSSRTATAVLEHLREFKAWWRASANLSVTERVTELFQLPKKWPSLEAEQQLEQTLRIELNYAEDRWLREVQLWWAEGKPWSSQSNFFISCRPGAVGLSIDLYGDALREAKSTHHVAQLMAKHCAKTWKNKDDVLNVSIWRGCARVIMELFGERLSEGYSLRLRPVDAVDHHHGLAAFAERLEDLKRVTEKLAAKVRDDGRQAELIEMWNVLDSVKEGAAGVWFALYARLHILDADDKDAAEIDILLGRVDERGCSWILGEVKSGAKRSTAAQMIKMQSILCESWTAQDLTTSKSRVSLLHFNAKHILDDFAEA